MCHAKSASFDHAGVHRQHHHKQCPTACYPYDEWNASHHMLLGHAGQHVAHVRSFSGCHRCSWTPRRIGTAICIGDTLGQTQVRKNHKPPSCFRPLTISSSRSCSLVSETLFLSLDPCRVRKMVVLPRLQPLRQCPQPISHQQSHPS